MFQRPVPYGEVDADYHLCPLPKYIVHSGDTSHHKQTQKQYLDREVSVGSRVSLRVVTNRPSLPCDMAAILDALDTLITSGFSPNTVFQPTH